MIRFLLVLLLFVILYSSNVERFTNNETVARFSVARKAYFNNLLKRLRESNKSSDDLNRLLGNLREDPTRRNMSGIVIYIYDKPNNKILSHIGPLYNDIDDFSKYVAGTVTKVHNYGDKDYMFPLQLTTKQSYVIEVNAFTSATFDNTTGLLQDVNFVQPNNKRMFPHKNISIEIIRDADDDEMKLVL